MTAKHHDSEVSVVTTGTPGILLARTGMPELHLYMAMTLRCIPDPSKGPFRMTTMRYDYELSERGDVMFGWHWHPESKRSTVRWPHLHLPPGSAYRSKHVPTGRVALEDVLLFAINDMNAEPAHNRALEILQEVVGRHKEHRTWA
jgi:hypothetical protein